MMKQTKRGHRKMVLLAVASMAVLMPSVRGVAQTLTPNYGDLILGFRATGAPGETLNLEVDLGNMSNFYGAAVGSTIPLPALSMQDLSDVYGANWYTRTDLVWGAVATTGRASGTSDGHATVDTLWATTADGLPAWNRGSSFAQATASANIEPMFVGGSAGTLLGANSTTNSSKAAVINATGPGSWTYQDSKTAGESFGYFNPSVDGSANVAGGQAVLALYELQPGTGAGTKLGNLVLSQADLSFQAVPEPSVGMLVILGLGCSAMLLRRREAVRA